MEVVYHDLDKKTREYCDYLPIHIFPPMARPDIAQMSTFQHLASQLHPGNAELTNKVKNPPGWPEQVTINLWPSRLICLPISFGYNLNT